MKPDKFEPIKKVPLPPENKPDEKTEPPLKFAPIDPDEREDDQPRYGRR